MVKETLKHLVKVHTSAFHYNKTLQYAVEVIDTVKASTINSKKTTIRVFQTVSGANCYHCLKTFL